MQQFTLWRFNVWPNNLNAGAYLHWTKGQASMCLIVLLNSLSITLKHQLFENCYFPTTFMFLHSKQRYVHYTYINLTSNQTSVFQFLFWAFKTLSVCSMIINRQCAWLWLAFKRLCFNFDYKSQVFYTCEPDP